MQFLFIVQIPIFTSLFIITSLKWIFHFYLLFNPVYIIYMLPFMFGYIWYWNVLCDVTKGWFSEQSIWWPFFFLFFQAKDKHWTFLKLILQTKAPVLILFSTAKLILQFLTLEHQEFLMWSKFSERTVLRQHWLYTFTIPRGKFGSVGCAGKCRRAITYVTE